MKFEEFDKNEDLERVCFEKELEGEHFGSDSVKFNSC